MPLMPSRTFCVHCGLRRDLADADPPPLGRGAFDRIAHRLDRRALREVGLPGSVRPPLQQVAEVVDEARAVTDPLPDRPPAASVWMGLVLGADSSHAVQPGLVAAIAVEQLVQARVLEDQRARGTVDLDGEVA